MKSVSPHSQKSSLANFHQHQRHPGIRRPSLSGPSQPCLPHWLTWPPCITRLFVTVNPWLFQGGQAHTFFSVSAAPFVCFRLKKWAGSSKFSPVITLSAKPSRLFLAFYLELSRACAGVQFSSVQSLSRVRLCKPMDCSMPGLPVPHHSRSPPKLMSIESVMPSNHLILCRSLLLPSIFPSIRVFPSDTEGQL